MAISSMGICLPSIPEVARSPKIRRMGSVTPPPPATAAGAAAIRARVMASYDTKNLRHPLNLPAPDKDGHKPDPGDPAADSPPPSPAPPSTRERGQPVDELHHEPQREKQERR